jgi:hypothetical protein
MHVLILHTMDVDGLQIEQSDIKNKRVRKYGVEATRSFQNLMVSISALCCSCRGAGPEHSRARIITLIGLGKPAIFPAKSVPLLRELLVELQHHKVEFSHTSQKPQWESASKSRTATSKWGALTPKSKETSPRTRYKNRTSYSPNSSIIAP